MDARCVYANSTLLSLRSPFFHAHFQNLSRSRLYDISLDIDSPTACDLLTFIYTGESIFIRDTLHIITTPTSDIDHVRKQIPLLVNLAHAAHRIKLPTLQQLACETLLELFRLHLPLACAVLDVVCKHRDLVLSFCDPLSLWRVILSDILRYTGLSLLRINSSSRMSSSKEKSKISDNIHIPNSHPSNPSVKTEDELVNPSIQSSDLRNVVSRARAREGSEQQQLPICDLSDRSLQYLLSHAAPVNTETAQQLFEALMIRADRLAPLGTKGFYRKQSRRVVFQDTSRLVGMLDVHSFDSQFLLDVVLPSGFVEEGMLNVVIRGQLRDVITRNVRMREEVDEMKGEVKRVRKEVMDIRSASEDAKKKVAECREKAVVAREEAKMALEQAAERTRAFEEEREKNQRKQSVLCQNCPIVWRADSVHEGDDGALDTSKPHQT